MLDSLEWWIKASILTALAMLSGFVGLLTQLLLKKAGVDDLFSAFAVAIAGWSGSETVVIFQEIFRGAIQKAGSATGNNGTKS